MEYEHDAYDLVPILSDYTNGTVTVSANNYWSYNALPYYPWKAFNGSVEALSDAWIINAKTGWLKVDFGSAKTVTAYSVAAFLGSTEITLANMPKNFRLLGNNTTNAAYDVLLDVQSDVTDWTDQEMRIFTLSSPATYRYFTLMINASNGLFCGVGEFGLRGNEAVISDFSVSVETSGNATIVTPTITASKKTGIMAALRKSSAIDMLIPISSFQARIETGITKSISAVVPGMDYAEQIADRSDATLTLYYADGVSATEIGSLPLTSIRIDEGANSKSITLQASV